MNSNELLQQVLNFRRNMLTRVCHCIKISTSAVKRKEMEARQNKIWKKEVIVMNNKSRFTNISNAAGKVNSAVWEITSADGRKRDYLHRL